MTICPIIRDEPLTLRTPDGGEVVVPPECSWLLTRKDQPVPTVLAPTGRFVERVSKRTGKTYRHAIIEESPCPVSRPHIVRVQANGWRFWRKGGEIHGEPVRVVALEQVRIGDAA